MATSPLADDHVIDEIPGLYRIIPVQVLRRIGNVEFDAIPIPNEGISGLDRVWHKGDNVLSPDSVEGVERPWYMHPYQDDYLMMFNGVRYNELYHPKNGHVTVEATTEYIKIDGKTVHEGSSAIVMWPRGVFHRIKSNGDAVSINLAVRYKEGFDIDTEFNVYDVNTETGESRLIREGHLDQPTPEN